MSWNQVCKILYRNRTCHTHSICHTHQHTLMLKALLNPEAKNPPKGAMSEAKMERGKEWNTAGYVFTVMPRNWNGTQTWNGIEHINTKLWAHSVICLDKEIRSAALISSILEYRPHDHTHLMLTATPTSLNSQLRPPH